MAVDSDFRLIAITAENPVPEEAKKIVFLLRSGFFRVHLRHPAASRREMRDLIEAIPLELHKRILLHGHFDLAADFNLGGLHLNQRCPVPPPFYRGGLSRSCHSIKEVEASEGMDYVTLSPVFDSISKKGYRSAFSADDLSSLSSLNIPVIALGGVNFNNITELGKYNFSGAAMLGTLEWELPFDEFSRKLKDNLPTC